MFSKHRRSLWLERTVLYHEAARPIKPIYHQDTHGNDVTTTAEQLRRCLTFPTAKGNANERLPTSQEQSEIQKGETPVSHCETPSPIMNVSVSYCSVAKTSSTTWKGILKSIRNEVKDTRRSRGRHHKEVSFMFVRDPYSRLLSAYVDKLFSPCFGFWKTFGSYIVSRFRPHQAKNVTGHDVSFAEFIKYFIHMEMSGQSRNAHFTPMHEHCQLCKKDYTYIGHLETLKEDMPFILDAIQSPVTYNLSFDSRTVVKNAYRDLTSKALSVISVDQACRRLWKKWQIRGIISKTEPFPLTKEQTENFSIKDLNQAAVAAVVRSREDSGLRGQKQEALREAFASVPLEDRLQVKRLMFLDFEMFGFDPEPEDVFPRSPFIPDADFSYFDFDK